MAKEVFEMKLDYPRELKNNITVNKTLIRPLQLDFMLLGPDQPI